MIEAHMTFAEKGAARYARIYRGRYSYDEFCSAAYTGLVVAARKFDPSRPIKFSSYAFIWIDQHLKRMPMVERRQTGWQYAPTKAEAAAGKKGMVRTLQILQWPETKHPTSGYVESYDVPDPTDFEHDIVERDEHRWQRQVITATGRTARERRILRGHLNGLTLAEIGQREGVSRQRIEQILSPALERARRLLPRKK